MPSMSTIEVRSGALARTRGSTPSGNDLGVAGVVVGIGVNVSHVGGEILAADGEGGGVENVTSAGLPASSSCSLDELSAVPAAAAFSLIVGQNNGAVSKSAGPVGVDLLAVPDAA